MDGWTDGGKAKHNVLSEWWSERWRACVRSMRRLLAVSSFGSGGARARNAGHSPCRRALDDRLIENVTKSVL